MKTNETPKAQSQLRTKQLSGDKLSIKEYRECLARDMVNAIHAEQERASLLAEIELLKLLRMFGL